MSGGFQCSIRPQQGASIYHLSETDVDFMTTLSVMDQPITHTHTDFMQSYGQYWLQSKAVEL